MFNVKLDIPKINMNFPNCASLYKSFVGNEIGCNRTTTTEQYACKFRNINSKNSRGRGWKLLKVTTAFFAMLFHSICCFIFEMENCNLSRISYWITGTIWPFQFFCFSRIEFLDQPSALIGNVPIKNSKIVNEKRRACLRATENQI